MKKINRNLVIFSLAALLLGGCQSQPAAVQSPAPSLLEEIQARGVLRIGTEGTYSPNSYHDENGSLTGFDVEVARGVAEKLGVRAEFVEAEWDSLFAALDSGRIDTVINEVEYSEERAQKYDFSEPYTYVHGALLTAADNQELNAFDDLTGKRSAQNLTSSWGRLAESYGAQLISVDTLTQCVELINSDRADATLNAETAFYDYLKQHPEAPVRIAAMTETVTSSRIPVRKGNESLVKAVNEALASMRESGELAALSVTYFGQDITSEQTGEDHR